MCRGCCAGWGWVRWHRDRQIDIDVVVMLGSGLESGVVIETVPRSWCLSMRGMLCSIRDSLRHVRSPGDRRPVLFLFCSLLDGSPTHW